MLREAIPIIRALFDAGLVDRRGDCRLANLWNEKQKLFGNEDHQAEPVNPFCE
jgi:hypothetical protein